MSDLILPTRGLLIPRQEDGQVDLESEMALTLADLHGRVSAMPASPDRVAEEINLIRVLGAVGWWEAWLHALVPEYVDDFSTYQRAYWNWLVQLDDRRPRPMIACWPRGGGKALHLDTPLPTPSGWTTMRDVKPGDTVLDHAGRPVRVTTRSTDQVKPGYRVVFDDGAEVIASGDHLWTVVTRQTLAQMGAEGFDPSDPSWPSWEPRGNGGRRSAAETMTTVELIPRMLDRLFIPAADGSARRIDRIEPIGDIDCACIGVDSADHLYLAGERPVATHNTTSVQLSLLYAACHHLRGYGIYVGQTQSAVEDKVSAVGEVLMNKRVSLAYPEVSKVYATATGAKRDWRRSRIRTASNFTLDAFGMDQALRGVKVDELRPGIIVLDDIEEYHDSAFMTQKRIDVLTRTIIPAAAPNAVIIFIQNKIKEDSIMAMLLDDRADFLADRQTVGPIPQIEDMVTESYTDDDGRLQHRIIAGTPTWPQVLGLEVSNQQLKEEGLAAFLSEKQHDTSVVGGDRFPADKWVMVDSDDWPDFVAVCRAWDLAGSESEQADYTVGVLLGIDRGLDPWILDITRGRWTVDKVEERVAACAIEDRELLRREVPAIIERQPGTAQPHWERQWKQRLTPINAAYDFIAPVGTKSDRAEALSGRQRRGEVRLTKGNYTHEFIHELALFPDYGRHDDQVDALVYAYRWCATKADIGHVTVKTPPRNVQRRTGAANAPRRRRR